MAIDEVLTVAGPPRGLVAGDRLVSVRQYAQLEPIPISSGHVVGTAFDRKNRPSVVTASEQDRSSGRDRRRSGDLTLFRCVANANPNALGSHSDDERKAQAPPAKLRFRLAWCKATCTSFIIIAPSAVAVQGPPRYVDARRRRFNSRATAALSYRPHVGACCGYENAELQPFRNREGGDRTRGMGLGSSLIPP